MPVIMLSSDVNEIVGGKKYDDKGTSNSSEGVYAGC